MNTTNYICCFCGKLIESNLFDITGIFVILNWDKKKNEQQEQQLFCHIKCLKLKLHKNVPLYLLELIDAGDDDFHKD